MSAADLTSADLSADAVAQETGPQPALAPKPGTAHLVMDGKTYTLRPLSVGSVRQLGSVIDALALPVSAPGKSTTADDVFAQLGHFGQIVWHSLKRSHGDITPDQLEELLSVAELTAAVRVVLELSGFTGSAEKNAPAPVTAASPSRSPTGTGAASTPTS